MLNFHSSLISQVFNHSQKYFNQKIWHSFHADCISVDGPNILGLSCQICKELCPRRYLWSKLSQCWQLQSRGDDVYACNEIFKNHFSRKFIHYTYITAAHDSYSGAMLSINGQRLAVIDSVCIDCDIDTPMWANSLTIMYCVTGVLLHNLHIRKPVT